MTSISLLWRSLQYYWRWHLGLAVAVAIASAVIAGSLAVGDSVRTSLARQAAHRLGRVQSVVIGGDRFFTEVLARSVPGTPAPVIIVRGTVADSSGSQRVAGVNIIGVTDEFWALALVPAAPKVSGDTVAVNSALARALGVHAPDEVVIRMEKPAVLSKDAPLSGAADETATLRASVGAETAASALGDFSLAANQTTPKNIFVALDRLQAVLQQAGKVNAVLSTAPDGVTEALEGAWTLDDAGLAVTKIDALGVWDISTTRVFLDRSLARALQEIFPSTQGVLTYMINRIRGPGPGATPYSMATAAASFGLAPGEVALTSWTADDVGAAPGDMITVDYYEVGRGRQLESRETTFTVKEIIPMAAPVVRPDWTPAFPGVMDAPRCRDWKPGVAMDMTTIRPKDESYWSEFKGTPKFFISLADGQRLWGNRFGELTALRLPAADVAGPATVLERLHSKVGLAELGLTVARPADAARAAVDQSYDLGGLFLGMSIFLIMTALLLVALMFLLNLESRASQLGVLRALGWGAPPIRRLVVAEAAVVAALGAGVGLAGGVVHTTWILGELSGRWSGAVGSLPFVATFRPATFAIAAGITILLAVGAVGWAARRFLKRQPKDLLSGPGATVGLGTEAGAATRGGWIGWMSLACMVAAVLLAFLAKGSPPAFFGVGSLIMGAGLAGVAALLRRGRHGSSTPRLSSLWELGLRNTTRNPGRSLAVAGLLAAGVFMISSMDAFQLDATRDQSLRSAGTGGFALVGEATLPVYENLNTPTGRAATGLDEEDMRGVSLVQARVREGDEASCLNLQRPQNPRVLGIDPNALAARGAFSFAAGASAWSVLETWDGHGPVPAVLDANYVRYTLKGAVGDVLNVRDDRGGTVPLRIAALLAPSVLQGSAVIAESAFEKIFPESGGYRFFLIDAPPASAAAASRLLTRLLENRGLALTPAAARLNEYNAVQNTYLRIFSALGGLGLILSTAGLGLLLARNVLARRAEFGLLQAVGFQRSALRRIVLGENAVLLLTGLLIGTVAALVAVWPVSRGASLPVGTLLAILAGGLFFCLIAAHAALRGSLIAAIRSE